MNSELLEKLSFNEAKNKESQDLQMEEMKKTSEKQVLFL